MSLVWRLLTVLCSPMDVGAVAWSFCSELSGLKELDEPYPVSMLNWLTMGWAGAASWVHVDAAGFGTAIWQVTGTKSWSFGRTTHITSMSFLPKSFQPRDPATTDLEFDTVLIGPGVYTCVIHRPLL